MSATAPASDEGMAPPARYLAGLGDACSAVHPHVPGIRCHLAPHPDVTAHIGRTPAGEGRCWDAYGPVADVTAHDQRAVAKPPPAGVRRPGPRPSLLRPFG